MARFRLMVFLLVLVMVLLVTGCSAGPGAEDEVAVEAASTTSAPVDTLHPNAWPLLEPGAEYPRASAEVLAVSGYPDHLHSYWWPDWQAQTHPDGTTFGPGAFCQKRKPMPREGLVIGEDSKANGNFVVRHNPGYKPCDMLPLLELLTWAAKVNDDLLGLATEDTLTVLNPDNIPSYREITGQDVWRLYKLEGDTCIIEPYGTLQARTLDGHAIFMLVTEWLLQKNLPAGMPTWMRQGIVEYVAEDGPHLRNYMGEFRAQGSLLFSPPLINAILERGVDPDKARDREMYRRSCYSSFLMVWRLVENEGGMVKLRRFIDTVRDSGDYDQAAQKVYDVDMNGLALRLDPAKLGEPVPASVEVLSPSVKP